VYKYIHAIERHWGREELRLSNNHGSHIIAIPFKLGRRSGKRHRMRKSKAIGAFSGIISNERDNRRRNLALGSLQA
jgi:hypothetical protein